MSASPPRQASPKKRKRQVVQSEDEEGEYNPSGPLIEVSTPPSRQPSTEKRSVKTLKPKPKPRTSITRSSKRGKKAPPSDDESDSEVETEETEVNDEAPRKASSKSPSKENVKDKDPDGERATKKPRLTAGTAGEKPKRQASSASVKPSKKAPNVGASGSGQQTPAKPPPPVGEKKTTSVVSEAVGRSALPHRREIAVATQELDMNDPATWSSLLKKDKDKDKDKSKDDSTGDPLTRYGYDLSRKERADRRNAELAKMKADYGAQKAANKKPPFDLQAQNRKIHHVQDRLRKARSRVCPNVLASAISRIHPEWFPPGVKPPT